MTWVGALLFIVSLLVCAELYAMRSMIYRMHDEVEKLNETVRQMIIKKLDEELHDDDE